MGLYGGSELPGILAGDQVFNDACREAGYREIDRVIVMLLELSSFRPPIARNLRQLRREVACQEKQAPRSRLVGLLHHGRLRTHSLLFDSIRWWKADSRCVVLGRRTPFQFLGAPAAGMFDLDVPATERRKGLATYLLGEAFERLRTRGVLLVEAQTMQHNAPALALYQKLGFRKVDEGIVYRKDA